MKKINANMEQLNHAFNEQYQFLYEADGYVNGTHEAIHAFDVWMTHCEEFRDLVHEFVVYRQDLLTSDREVAAFIFAAEEYLTKLLPPLIYGWIAEDVRNEYEVELKTFRIYDTAKALFQAERKNLSRYAEETGGEFILDEDNVFYARNKFIYATEWGDD